MPIVARGGGLGFAIIVTGGIGEIFIVKANTNLCPILCRTAVIHGFLATTTPERTLTDACHAISNDDALKATAPRERTISDACHAIRDGDALKATAIKERMPADACHAIRNGDALKATAISERIIADACHTTRDGDTRKTSTTLKDIFANLRKLAVFAESDTF